MNKTPEYDCYTDFVHYIRYTRIVAWHPPEKLINIIVHIQHIILTLTCLITGGRNRSQVTTAFRIQLVGGGVVGNKRRLELYADLMQQRY